MPLQHSLALVNGLNSAASEHGTGIREGRFEGRDASANINEAYANNTPQGMYGAYAEVGYDLLSATH